MSTRVMGCSTCDGYQFVPGADGLLVRCLDCLEHCRAHPAESVVNGRCGACLTEASVASELLYEARRVGAVEIAAKAAA